MRNLRRNTRKMYYALYVEDSESEFDPLEKVSKYSEPKEFYAIITSGKSDAEESPFGKDTDYDRVITTVDKTLPITETSLIWKETKPQTMSDGSVDSSTADYKVAAYPIDSLDGLQIAVKRIKKNAVIKNTVEDVIEDMETDSSESVPSEDDGF